MIEVSLLILMGCLSVTYLWTKSSEWKIYGIITLVVVLTSLIIMTVSLIGKVQDTEIWNGSVTHKERLHGSYEQPYDCFCTTDSKGNRSCQTCYETHFTVDWLGKTTVGDFYFKSLDSTSRSVYSTPDPLDYKKCVIGEPASIEHTFTNYVKSSPESLFNDSSIKKKDIPAYPRVYDHYKINRVINQSKYVSKEAIDSLNTSLNQNLIQLGGKKQVNIIVIVTDSSDQAFRHQVESAWIGGKKNDVVVFWSTAGWKDVMTFGKNIGNEYFSVSLRDNLYKMKEFIPEEISKIITSNIENSYDRPTMESFKYLKENIDIPLWAMILSVLISFSFTIFIIIKGV